MDSTGVPAGLDRAAQWSWRLLVIAAAVAVTGVVALRLRLVIFPVYAALLVTAVCEPVAIGLRRWRLPRQAAAAGALAALAGLLVAAGLFVVPAVAGEVGDLEATITTALDDIEDWLVTDSPFDVNRADIDRLRADAGEALRRILRDNQDQLVGGAVLAAEVVAGTVVALVVAFFLLSDGRRFQATALGWFAGPTRTRVAAAGRAAWTTVRGYVAGAAALGIIEGVVIGVALWLVGGSLVAPVAVITFLAAFVPFVGAVVAGVIAVLVALVTAGVPAAVVVAVVAVVVQQLDNDLLAPVVYGRALDLHPVAILLSVTAAGSVAGLAGAFLAVPVTATAVNVTRAWRSAAAEPAGAPPDPDPGTGPADDPAG